MGIASIREKSNRFVANLNLFVAEALMQNQESYTEMNRKQMQASMRADGERIEPAYRSESYAKKKGRNYPDLKLTGAFQTDMFFQTDGDEFFITSEDEKMPKLVDKYSLKIFGVAPFYQKLAQQISVSALARIYNKFVLNG